MELVQVKEFRGWVALWIGTRDKGAYTHCYRCNENGEGQAGDGEQSNQFELEPIAYKHSGEVWGYRVIGGTIIETVDETAERAAAHEKWLQTERAVTLTNDQWSTLTIFLGISTKYRESEAKAWAKLAERKDDNGEPEFKNAASNAMFWRETIKKIENITKTIEP
jgi:hypothetical protein